MTTTKGKIPMINITQHPATPEQISAGVREAALAGDIRQQLTFSALPTRAEIVKRARNIALLAWSDANWMDDQPKKAMIGGAPYLMATLERELYKLGITPYYSYSTRASEEVTAEDGTVRKISVFRHLGFVPAGFVPDWT